MVWWKDPCFLCLYIWEIFIKKKTSIAVQLHVFVLPNHMMIFMIQIFTHMCLVVALSFIKLCDPIEMSFILAWSRSRALHQLNFYTESQLCHSIHPQNKTPYLMISLSLVSFKWGMGYPKKRWHAQEAWPQKKMDTSMSMKKKIYIYIAMPSCYPNKGERDS